MADGLTKFQKLNDAITAYSELLIPVVVSLMILHMVVVMAMVVVTGSGSALLNKLEIANG